MNRPSSHTLLRTLAAVSLTGAVALAAGPAMAATGPSPSTNPPATLAQIQAAAAAAVNARETQLGKLSARLSAAPGCDNNGTVAGIIATDGPALTQLLATIDADTTVAAARVDYQAIFDYYRIYMLVSPQADTAAACGLILKADTHLTTDEATLSARVKAVEALGTPLPNADASLADMTAKLADGTAQANSAYSALSSLVPDRGNKAVQATNQAAVATAHGELETAHTDLVAALADARAVVADLNAIHAG